MKRIVKENPDENNALTNNHFSNDSISEFRGLRTCAHVDNDECVGHLGSPYNVMV